MAGRSLSLFLIAGEPSGDRLGASLMRGLAAEGAHVQYLGVGGEAMAAEGLESLFPIEETSIMGIAEVLPRLPNLIRRINQTVEAVLSSKPDALITIDSPGFTMRVAKKVRAAAPDIPIIHYVAPSVWAWRPGRAKKMAAHVDHVLALLPFEPPYMTEAGMTCDFVGHPVVERTAHVDPNDRSFRAEIGVSPDQPLIAVLPGSRNSEITRLAPVFGEALGMLVKRHPDLAVVVPAAETIVEPLKALVADWPVKPVLLDPRDLPVAESETRKFRALAACDVALAASGTISLELAAMETPTVIAYRGAPATVFIVRRLLKVKSATIANLVLDENIVPEFLQEFCTPEALAGAIEELLVDPAAREKQIDGARRALALLGRGGEPPSRRAARSVLAAIDRAKGAA